MKDADIQIRKGARRDHVFVDRLWRTLDYEEVDLRAHDSVSAARETDVLQHAQTAFIAGRADTRSGISQTTCVIVPINGKKYWLWRAVDSRGDMLDILVQSRRNRQAAIRFFRKLFKVFAEPRVIVTEKLKSDRADLKELAPGLEHRSHKGLNNRSEGSHRPTRRREKIMGRVKSPRQAQRFFSVHDQVHTIFRPRRHTLSAAARWIWEDVTRELKAARGLAP